MNSSIDLSGNPLTTIKTSDLLLQKVIRKSDTAFLGVVFVVELFRWNLLAFGRNPRPKSESTLYLERGY